MSNRYVTRIRDMEKRSSLSLAAAAHVGQSTITKRLLHNKKFARSVANHGLAGFSGLSVPKKTMREVGKGILSPEAAILQREAHHAGSMLKKELSKLGINPEKLTKREMVNMRRLTRGDFLKLERQGYLDTPTSKAIIRSLETSGSLPKGALTSITGIKDPARRKAALQDIEKVWKDKSNPLTSNIAGNITRPSMKTSQMTAGKGRDSTREMLLSNVGIAAADPVTAGINATKAAISSETLKKKVPAVAALNKKMADKVIMSPSQKAYQRGLEGKDTFGGKIGNFAQTYAVNPISGQASKLGNELGKVVKKHSAT